jgi:Planctomycete cytochrome C/WD domain, G-beta repeat
LFRVSVISLLGSSLLLSQEKVSYDDHILPIFEQSCLNCHNPDKTKGGLDLSNYAGAIKGGSSGKIVEPGDTSSTLVNCVKQTAEPKMPPEGEKLSSAQIALIEKWIVDGLLENKTSSARKPSKPKFETSVGSDPATKPEGPPPMPQQLLLEPPVITGSASAVHAIAASPWAPLLAVTGQRQILLHHTETLELIGILPFPEGDPISLAFTPDARYLIVGGGIPGKSGITVTFDVTTGSRTVSAAKEFDSILAADIRPTFDIVASGGPSKLLKLWDTRTGQPLHSIKKHTDWITSLDISPDGILLASGDRNGGVWVWESESANEFHTLRGHQAGITALSFRADSNILGSASEDGSVRFWEMNNGGEVKKIDAHPGGVTAFAFAKNGAFVTAGRDNKAKLWKSDFNALREISLPSLPTAAAIEWEGKRAFVADASGNVQSFSAEENGTPALAAFPSNPPSIETRLRLIAQRISGEQRAVAEAGASAGATQNAIKAAADLLAAEENNHRQAQLILSTCTDGAAKAEQELAALKAKADAPPAAIEQAATMLLAAKKNLEAAQARIAPTKAQVDAARKSLDEAKAIAAGGTQKLDAANAAIASLRAQEKIWSAAAINTHALQASAKAQKLSELSETEIEAFHQALAALAEPNAKLVAKRSERDEFAAKLKTSSLTGAAAHEALATLRILDASVKNLTDTLSQQESKLAESRAKIDTTIKSMAETQRQSNQLRESYFQAMK